MVIHFKTTETTILDKKFAQDSIIVTRGSKVNTCGTSGETQIFHGEPPGDPLITTALDIVKNHHINHITNKARTPTT